MQDNEIKNLLENIEVQPSARCWQAIEGQLAAGAAASGAAASAHAAKHAGWLSTTVGKVVVGAIAAAAVTTGVVLATYSSNKSESVVEEPVAPAAAQVAEPADAVAPEAQTVAFADAAPAMQSAAGTTEVAEPTTTIAAAAEVTEPAPSTTQPAAPVVVPKQAKTSGNQTTITKPRVSAAPVNTPVNTTVSSQTAAPTIATPSSSSDYSDPVLENRTDYESIAPAEPVRIGIPNVITPNGDGYNDFFVISGIENCEQTKLIIKNRSGATILQVSNYANNWDANNVPTGTYYYQFFYKIHGIQEMRTGTLTILR